MNPGDGCTQGPESQSLEILSNRVPGIGKTRADIPGCWSSEGLSPEIWDPGAPAPGLRPPTGGPPRGRLATRPLSRWGPRVTALASAPASSLAPSLSREQPEDCSEGAADNSAPSLPRLSVSAALRTTAPVSSRSPSSFQFQDGDRAGARRRSRNAGPKGAELSLRRPRPSLLTLWPGRRAAGEAGCARAPPRGPRVGGGGENGSLAAGRSPARSPTTGSGESCGACAGPAFLPSQSLLLGEV